MKQEIYQSGFYLMLGLILGIGIMLMKPESKPVVPITIEVVKDSTAVAKPTQKLALTEKTLKAELVKYNIPHSNIVLAQAKLESNHFKSDLVKSHQNILGMKAISIGNTHIGQNVLPITKGEYLVGIKAGIIMYFCRKSNMPKIQIILKH